MTKTDYKPNPSIDQENTSIPTQSDTTEKLTDLVKKVTETVFVNGERRPEFEDTIYFPSNGKNFMCYTEFLDDVVTATIDPIRDNPLTKIILCSQQSKTRSIFDWVFCWWTKWWTKKRWTGGGQNDSQRKRPFNENH